MTGTGLPGMGLVHALSLGALMGWQVITAQHRPSHHLCPWEGSSEIALDLKNNVGAVSCSRCMSSRWPYGKLQRTASWSWVKKKKSKRHNLISGNLILRPDLWLVRVAQSLSRRNSVDDAKRSAVIYLSQHTSHHPYLDHVVVRPRRLISKIDLQLLLSRQYLQHLLYPKNKDWICGVSTCRRLSPSIITTALALPITTKADSWQEFIISTVQPYNIGLETERQGDKDKKRAQKGTVSRLLFHSTRFTVFTFRCCSCLAVS